jgi:hypothetical protein
VVSSSSRFSLGASPEILEGAVEDGLVAATLDEHRVRYRSLDPEVLALP